MKKVLSLALCALLLCALLPTGAFAEGEPSVAIDDPNIVTGDVDDDEEPVVHTDDDDRLSADVDCDALIFVDLDSEPKVIYSQSYFYTGSPVALAELSGPHHAQYTEYDVYAYVEPKNGAASYELLTYDATDGVYRVSRTDPGEYAIRFGLFKKGSTFSMDDLLYYQYGNCVSHSASFTCTILNKQLPQVSASLRQTTVTDGEAVSLMDIVLTGTDLSDYEVWVWNYETCTTLTPDTNGKCSYTASAAGKYQLQLQIYCKSLEKVVMYSQEYQTWIVNRDDVHLYLGDAAPMLDYSGSKQELFNVIVSGIDPAADPRLFISTDGWTNYSELTDPSGSDSGLVYSIQAVDAGVYGGYEFALYAGGQFVAGFASHFTAYVFPEFTVEGKDAPEPLEGGSLTAWDFVKSITAVWSANDVRQFDSSETNLEVLLLDPALVTDPSQPVDPNDIAVQSASEPGDYILYAAYTPADFPCGLDGQADVRILRRGSATIESVSALYTGDPVIALTISGVSGQNYIITIDGTQVLPEEGIVTFTESTPGEHVRNVKIVWPDKSFTDYSTEVSYCVASAEIAGLTAAAEQTYNGKAQALVTGTPGVTFTPTQASQYGFEAAAVTFFWRPKGSESTWTSVTENGWPSAIGEYEVRAQAAITLNGTSVGTAEQLFEACIAEDPSAMITAEGADLPFTGEDQTLLTVTIPTGSGYTCTVNGVAAEPDTSGVIRAAETDPGAYAYTVLVLGPDNSPLYEKTVSSRIVGGSISGLTAAQGLSYDGSAKTLVTGEISAVLTPSAAAEEGWSIGNFTYFWRPQGEDAWSEVSADGWPTDAGSYEVRCDGAVLFNGEPACGVPVSHSILTVSIAVGEGVLNVQPSSPVYKDKPVEILHITAEGDPTVSVNGTVLTKDTDGWHYSVSKPGDYELTVSAVWPNGNRKAEKKLSLSVYEAVGYVDEKGISQFCEDFTPFSLVTGTNLSEGWYYVDRDCTVASELTVDGNVRFILRDDVTLTAPKGILVTSNSSFTIYGQVGGSGALIAGASDRPLGENHAGIGAGSGEYQNAGQKITINGGNVTAYGTANGAAIGGGDRTDGQTVVINGGNVTAYGSTNSAAIGGGNYGKNQTVTITDGSVTAFAGKGSGAAIGGGKEGTGQTVTIEGGIVTAYGNTDSAAIGGGSAGDGQKILISGGSVTASVNKGNGAAIGGGYEGDNQTITISGGTVNATVTSGLGAAIGGGNEGDDQTITVSGGSITATAAGSTGAAIGGGNEGDDQTITVSGGSITATADDSTSAAIGGGSEGDRQKVTIDAGTVIAIAGEGAGIGGGYNADDQTILIAGGSVTASSQNGAGIGGGYDADGQTVTITGGSVTASSQNGAGIGAGNSGKNQAVVINGGSVTASSENSACVGGKSVTVSGEPDLYNDELRVPGGRETAEDFTNTLAAHHTVHVGPHDIESLAAVEPGITTPGRKACFRCKNCGFCYEDAEASAPIGDEDAFAAWQQGAGRIDTLTEQLTAYTLPLAAQAEALAKDGDSEACAKLISDAKALLTAPVYDGTLTLAENEAAADRLLTGLAADLAVQRAADTLAANEASFKAYTDALAAQAQALSEPADSDAAAARITDAAAALKALNYDETRSLDENKAAADAVLADLRTDLAAQRAADALAANKAALASYAEALAAEAEALSDPADSDAAAKRVADAAAALKALNYDETRSLDENKAAADAILADLRTDLAAQRAADALAANKAAFASYAEGLADEAEALARTGDSEAAAKRVTDAAAALKALPYDETLSLDENKAAADAILAELRTELPAQRSADFTVYAADLAAEAEALTLETDGSAEAKLIADAAAALQALKYDDSLTPAENAAAAEKILSDLKADLEIQRDAVITSGKGAKWTKKSAFTLSFTCKAPFGAFQKLLVDGQVVTASGYSVRSGSTVVELKPSFLETLSVGTHTIRFVYTGSKGELLSEEGTFIVSASTSSPATGDAGGMSLWLTAMLLSASALVLLKKKRFL